MLARVGDDRGMETLKSILLETLLDARDFILGSLPLLAALVGVCALVVLPLVWVARSAGVL